MSQPPSPSEDNRTGEQQPVNVYGNYMGERLRALANAPERAEGVSTGNESRVGGLSSAQLSSLIDLRDESDSFESLEAPKL